MPKHIIRGNYRGFTVFRSNIPGCFRRKEFWNSRDAVLGRFFREILRRIDAHDPHSSVFELREKGAIVASEVHHERTGCKGKTFHDALGVLRKMRHKDRGGAGHVQVPAKKHLRVHNVAQLYQLAFITSTEDEWSVYFGLIKV